MADTISDIKAFKEACFSQFLAEHPDICERWLQHFGRRIDEVRRGVLDERDFTGQWQAWTPADTASSCPHHWVDARNEVVRSGEVCLRCGAVRASAHSANP